MLELPIAEDIYDFDTFTLRDHYENISREFEILSQETQRTKELTTWLKKAKKLLDMISLEVEERQAVEDFGSFCEKGEQYLATLDNFNPYANEKSKQSKLNHENLLPKTIGNVIVELPESEASTGLDEDNTQSEKSRNTVHFEDRKSETTDQKSHVESLDQSSISAVKIYETMHHGIKKKPNKANAKKNALYEFMKETLANTRVTENITVGQSAVGQKKPQLTSPDPMKKKDNASTSIVSEPKKAHKSVPLRKPDPGFSTRDTKTQNFMDLGGGPINKPAVSNMKKASSAKKKEQEVITPTTKPKKELPLIRKETPTSLEKKPERKQSAESSLSTKSNKLPSINQPKETKKEEKKLVVSQSKSEIKLEQHIAEEIERDPEDNSDQNQTQEAEPKYQSDKEIEERIDTGSEEDELDDEEEVRPVVQKKPKNKKTQQDDISPFDDAEESAEDLTAFKRSKAVTKKMNNGKNEPSTKIKKSDNEKDNTAATAKSSNSKTPTVSETGIKKTPSSAQISDSKSVENKKISGTTKNEIAEKAESISKISADPSENSKTIENKKSAPVTRQDFEDLNTKSEKAFDSKSEKPDTSQSTRTILSEKNEIIQNQINTPQAKQAQSLTNITTSEHTVTKDSTNRDIDSSTPTSLKSGSSQSMRPLSEQAHHLNPPGYVPQMLPRRGSVDYLDDSDYSDLDEEAEKLEVRSVKNEDKPGTSMSQSHPDFIKKSSILQKDDSESKTPSITLDNFNDEYDSKSKETNLDMVQDFRSPTTSNKQNLPEDISSSKTLTSPMSSNFDSAQKEESVIKRVPSMTMATSSRIEPLRGQSIVTQSVTNYKDELKQKLEEAQENKKAREIFDQDKKVEKLKASLSKQSLALSASKSQLPIAMPESQDEANTNDQLAETVDLKATLSTAKKLKVPGTNKKNDFINIPDEDIIDYSAHFDSFQKIFTGSLLEPNKFDYLNTMRELLHMFSTHVGKVDNMDSILSKYKPSLAPLEFGPNDMLALNNPNQIMMYANKTNIDLRKFIERQQVFNQNVRIIQNNDEDGPQTTDNRDTLYYRVVKTKQEVYDIITRSFLRKKNWVELPHGMNLKTTWNLLWTWSKPEIDMTKLLYWQKVNHFPGNKAIVRKDLLKTNIEKMQKLGTKAAQIFNITPLTFFLPKEMTKFMETFYANIEKAGALNIWIMKPIGKSRGRGISLINDIGQIKFTEPVVVQEYLKNPLLLDGYKFDMRIYVLVTSLNPLEVYLYREGFARLSTAQFTLDEDDLKNLYIHLTNTSVQKYSNNAENFTSDAIIGGTKISLKTLKTRLEYRGIRWQTIWDQVGEIIVKSLVAVQNEIPHNPNCFELFGYDIIIDKNLKCWLLEVNSSPSLERMNILDDLVKQQLIDDIVDLTSPIQFDRKKLCQVLERRIQEEQRMKSTINTANNSKQQLNKDLTYILGGKKIRDVGTLPENMGNFERIAPTEMSDKIVKLVQSYKNPMRVPTQQEKRTAPLN